MIAEIVTFKIAKDLDRDAVVALYERSAPGWKSNPHLIHKSAGRRMVYAESGPERIAEAMHEELRAPRIPHPVARNGAACAAAMLSDLL